MASAIDKLIEKLMLRLGFVKLGSFGLTLTHEDRVLTLRPVLDDGMGGRIVGWRDTDLASTELPAWGSLVPATPMPSIHVHAAPPPLPPTWRAQTVAPPPVPPRAALMISPVAAAPPEEDWEWTLAVARARAQAEDPVVRPVAAAPAPAPKLAPLPVKTSPESKTAPMRAARVVEPERPIDTWNDAPTSAAPIRSTVIPVPTLPRLAKPAVGAQTSVYRPQPVVTSPLPGVRRIARGTRPPTHDMPAVVAANDDGTETHVQAAPSSDHTATQIQIAPAPARAKAGAIPSIKQRMAGR